MLLCTFQLFLHFVSVHIFFDEQIISHHYTPMKSLQLPIISFSDQILSSSKALHPARLPPPSVKTPPVYACSYQAAERDFVLPSC